MTDKNKKTLSYILFGLSGVCLVLFLLLIVAIKLIDVQAIGPNGSQIGLATINKWAQARLAYNHGIYRITELLGYISILSMGCFGIVGLCQWIKRRSLKRVDTDILLLGGFYVLLAAFYLLFEVIVINYRPVLVNGELEAAFPSSHTMLGVSAMGAAIYQLWRLVKNKFLKLLLISSASVVLVGTAIGRLFSGVHWLTDILGGTLLSLALILSYIALCTLLKANKK